MISLVLSLTATSRTTGCCQVVELAPRFDPGLGSCLPAQSLQQAEGLRWEGEQ